MPVTENQETESDSGNPLFYWISAILLFRGQIRNTLIISAGRAAVQHEMQHVSPYDDRTARLISYTEDPEAKDSSGNPNDQRFPLF